MLSEEFKQSIINIGKEFDSKNGIITAEFSLKRDNILDFLAFTKSVQITLGRWCIYSCKTCERHYGENYVHAEIIKW